MWKDIKGYEGLYQVSTEGKVRRIHRNGHTHEIKNRNGLYYTVCLSKKGIKKSYSVHRLVAETFLERPEGTDEVNHKDGNKLNNDISNLEWVTQQDNFKHMMTNLNKFPFGKKPRPVRCIEIDTGKVVMEFESVSAAARALGTISARAPIILTCQGYQNTAYGYKWEYI